MDPGVSEPASPLQIPEYRRFWLARFSSVAATSGLVVILGYQIYDIARSDYAMSMKEAAFQLGLIGLAQFLPLFFLTPVAGLAADRFDRRNVAALATFADLLVAGALAFVTFEGLRSLPVLFGLAALHGTARSFINPSFSAIAPNIVPANLIPKAIGLNSIAFQSGAVAGPAAAGFLYAASPASPYMSACALLALSMASVLTIRRLPPPPGAAQRHPVRQISEGFRFVWNERFLLGCITLDMFAVILGGATALLPIFARDILHVGAEGLGQMRAAPAVGAALVALFLSIRPLERNVGAKMLWAVAAYGAATIAFGLSREFMLSIAFLVFLGGADMVSVFVRSSLIQLNTPDDMRGRVSATSGLAISASNELGELQSGFAGALLGATGAVVFGGAGAILVTVMWMFLFPELIRARTFAPQYRDKEPSP
jgi:MFS family permease